MRIGTTLLAAGRRCVATARRPSSIRRWRFSAAALLQATRKPNVVAVLSGGSDLDVTALAGGRNAVREDVAPLDPPHLVDAGRPRRSGSSAQAIAERAKVPATPYLAD